MIEECLAIVGPHGHSGERSCTEYTDGWKMKDSGPQHQFPRYVIEFSSP